jgi:hypothetical protein
MQIKESSTPKSYVQNRETPKLTHNPDCLTSHEEMVNFMNIIFNDLMLRRSNLEIYLECREICE